MERLCRNAISTTNYTVISFIPKNLIIQFMKAANAYFLLITILQTIKTISITNGSPANLGPLLLLVAISMIKDAYEDIVRYRRDCAENETVAWQYKDSQNENQTQWADVEVGQIIVIKKDETIPADVVLLGSSDDGTCFVETKNLDGETNLKTK